MVINLNDICATDNNTPCVTILDERWQKCATHAALSLAFFERLSIIQNYCTIDRQKQTQISWTVPFCRSTFKFLLSTFRVTNNPLLKQKAKSTGKQRAQSHSLLPGGRAHMASDDDHEPEPRAFAEGGATLERPAAVDSCVHWPELSKFLTVSDVTMSAQQSGWGLSANGKVPRDARALIASSRFMKHARAWPADLLKKKVCSRPCCRHSDWILAPSNCNNKSYTSINGSSVSTGNLIQHAK